MIEIALRLLLAVLCGVAIGFDRDRMEKPAGMRTLGLVALAAAVVAVIATELPGADAPDAYSRVVQGAFQGVLAGVGFIGAGVVMHEQGLRPNVHGVTTAAAVWVSAALGLACGFGLWRIALLGLAFAFVLLVLVKPAEAWLTARLSAPDRRGEDVDKDDRTAPP